MTKDQYLMMCEQTGQEIDWERCPPEIEDFPESVREALNIFYTLGDRIYPDVGFIGKDYTNLKLLLKQFFIPKWNEEWVTELILHIEHITIKASQNKLKIEMDRLKRK